MIKIFPGIELPEKKLSMTLPLLGCIADDFTGATDLANNLVRTRHAHGADHRRASRRLRLRCDADAVVVALKSRTIAPAEAVAQSLAALRWLRAQGAQQIYFKYCSTFDSTPRGNIGPVTDALMDALHGRQGFTIACPAFPDNKRTVFKGHLFVGDVLLSDSGMQQPPAHAHDRRQPGARAAGADAPQGRPGRPQDVVARRRRGDPRALRGPEGAKAWAWRSSMRCATTI